MALNDYPEIEALRVKLSVAAGAMSQLCLNHMPGLRDLCTSIRTLDLQARPSLRGLAGKLFSEDVSKVLAAMNELLVFSWLKEAGVLTEGEIGFPSDWPSNDSPFEGAMAGPELLAFDVKDASGSGLLLLQDVLSKELRRYCEAEGLRPPDLHVAVDAPTGQKWFMDNFAAIVRPFREHIATTRASEGKSSYAAGDGKVRVGLGTRVGGSAIGMHGRASYIASQIAKHAVEKAEKLQSTPADRFFLVYVRRPHSGLADFDDHTFPMAVDFLAGMKDLPESLHAVAFLNFDSSEGVRVPYKILWQRASGLPTPFVALFDALVEAEAAPMPAERREFARAYPTGSIESTLRSSIGVCDLQQAECTAKGTNSPVFDFLLNGDVYRACAECAQALNWPRPGSALRDTSEAAQQTNED